MDGTVVESVVSSTAQHVPLHHVRFRGVNCVIVAGGGRGFWVLGLRQGKKDEHDL